MMLNKARQITGGILALLVALPLSPTAAFARVAHPALPVFSQTIHYYPYGQYVSKIYREWEQALSPLNAMSSPAYIQQNVIFYPAASLKRHAPVTANVYKIAPSTTAGILANRLAAAFGLKQTPVVYSRSHYQSVTATVGSLPQASAVLYSTQSNQNHGLATIGSPHGLRWVYGNGAAVAWRKCKPGDSTGKNVSVISHSSAPGRPSSCTALPANLGPTQEQAMQRSKQLFQTLGYASSSNPKLVPDGGLLLSATGFDESQDGRSTYYSATVSGYLKVAGQFTNLRQQVTFSSSSNLIVSASGFEGTPVAVAVAKLKTPGQAASQISVYDLDTTNSAHTFNLANPSWWGPRPDLSASITGGHSGSYSADSTAHRIYVTRFAIAPNIIQAYDGTTWVVPAYSFSDAGGYLGSVQGLLAQNLKTISYPPYSQG